MTWCTRCVMPVEKEGGLCEECRSFVPRTIDWQQKAEEFKNLVNAYRGTGKNYDVLIPLTGGKDSTFVLYYMTKVLGEKRILAYTWDNDLIRETAWNNIRNVVEATGVDHKIFQWNSHTMKRLFQATFRARGRVCFCPQLLVLNVFPFAIKEQIPLIITGYSEGQREMDHSFTIPDQPSQKKEFIKFYRFWREAFSAIVAEVLPGEEGKELINHVFSVAEPYAQPDSAVPYYPVLVPLSNYVNWTNMDDLQTTLTAHVNYQKAADTFAHTSCMIEPIKGYLEYKRNATEIASELSNLIRAGAVTREEGLEDIKKMRVDGSITEEEISAFCKFLDITKDEFSFCSDPATNKGLSKVPPQVVQQRIATLAWVMGIGKITATFK